MRKFITLVLICALWSSVYAQKKAPKYFQLPNSVSAKDYIHGTIAVKVKPEFIDEVANGRVGITNGRVTKPKPFLKHSFIDDLSSRRARPATINMRQYFYLSYDASKNIETVINELYATGMYEVVEPSYIAHTFETPNDPLLDQQYYLETIKAFEAWDITTGDTNIVIAIVDSGVEWDHPDLAANIHINYADPINGVDDDNDGFVDNFRGWDFVGDGDATEIGFNEDNDPTPDLSNHGTAVAGCASGVANNGEGIAGVGYKCKIMALKHSDGVNGRSIFRGYDGLMYAATHGADVINLSWGGEGEFSQIEQDLVTFAVVDQNAVVIVAAGNGGTDQINYPAGYEHALSISATDSRDANASFSTFGFTVDLAAPGVAIQTTDTNDGYTSIQGTSFSSPITAGAAALLRSVYPDFTAVQISELLRASSSHTRLYTRNTVTRDLQGKGLLDVFAAVTTKPSAIKFINYELVDAATGGPVQIGQPIKLVGDFTNYLWPSSSNLKVTVSTTPANRITLTSEEEVSLGVVQQDELINNDGFPFEFDLDANLESNTDYIIKLVYEDESKGYRDYQYIVLEYPSYQVISTDNITSAISNKGRIGRERPATGSGASAVPAIGPGFILNDRFTLLYQMGLMMGTSETSLVNAVSNESGFDEDFDEVGLITRTVFGDRGDTELHGKLNDSNAGTDALGLDITYTALAWEDTDYANFFVVEYEITNTTSETIEDYSIGLYADWDIASRDSAHWDDTHKLGFINNLASGDRVYGGIQLLEYNDPLCYSFNNDNNAPDNPFGIYDGFTDEEKWITLSSGLTVPEAGDSILSNNSDVSQVVGSSGYTILPNESIKIVYAIHGTASLEDLNLSATNATALWNTRLNQARPTVAQTNDVCYGDNITVTASTGDNFNWYTDLNEAPIATTASYEFTNVTEKMTLLVTSVDAGGNESLPVQVVVIPKALPIIAVIGSNICDGDTAQLIASEGDSYLWEEQGTTNTFNTRMIEVTNTGTYTVTITDTNLGCSTTSDPVTVTSITTTPIDFDATLQTDQYTGDFSVSSSNLLSISWDLGDGTTSDQASVTHTYALTEAMDYTVTLTTVDDDGCINTSTKNFSVTALEDNLLARSISVFPNPNNGLFQLQLRNEQFGDIRVKVYDVVGNLVDEKLYEKSSDLFQTSVDLSAHQQGQYLLFIETPSGLAVKRVVKQ